MKHAARYVIAACIALLWSLAAPAFSAGTHRPRVAVVLSGGGAKGTAHVGVLKVLERAGIPVDIVTGTSMGALVGGLYAIGYDATTLDSLVRHQDWNLLLSDRVQSYGQSLEERAHQRTYLLSRPLAFTPHKPLKSGGLIVGTNLSKLFSRLTMGYHDSIDFGKLPVPFACVATDIVTNTEYVFHSGYLSTAMRASMAIPGVFAPVRKDSMVLVDGGLRNNYPADIARQMGADVIIGVSVMSDERTADELNSAADILLQIVDINCKNKFQDNWSMTDIPVKVNVKGYSSASFTRQAVDTLIRRGEQAAMQQWPQLMALRQRLGIDTIVATAYRHAKVPTQEPQWVRVDSIAFEHIGREESKYIRQKYRLHAADSLPVNRIEQAVTALTNDYMYTGVTFSLTRQSAKSVLKIVAKDKRQSRVNLAMRFDTEEMVAMQANVEHQLNTAMPITLELTGRLGKRMMAQIDAKASPQHWGKMGLTYTFRHDDTNVYEHGSRRYNFIYNQHQLKLLVGRANFKNVSIDIDMRADFFDFHDVLRGVDRNEPLDNLHQYSYHFTLQYDSEDKWFFTTRGAYFTAAYSYLTDDFIGWKSHTGISAVNALWRMSFALNPRLVFQPQLYGRLLFGQRIPLIVQNAVGGLFAGHYIAQQLPFAGIGNMELVGNKFVACLLRLQQRIMDNNYVIGRAALAQASPDLRHLLKHGPMIGAELGYSYNSMFGPLGATLGYSSHTHQPYFYINLGFIF